MLILSSSGFSNDAIFTALEAENRAIHAGFRAVIIVTAAIPEKQDNRWVRLTKDCLQGKGAASVDYFDFKTDPAQDLFSYDLVFIAGGNPFELFLHAHNAGFRHCAERLISQRVVIGVSAGAMLFTRGIHYIEEFNAIMKFDGKGNDLGLTDLSGLRISDIILFPHYDQFLAACPDLEMGLQKIESRDTVIITRLKNGENMIIP